MYKKSEVKSKEILRLYKEGVMLTEICKLTVSSQTTVKKVLAFFDIDYDAERKAEYQKRLEKVVELYEQGKSQTYIEQTLNLTRKTIRTLLKSKEVKYKNKSEQWRLRWGSTLNEHCFDELTPESLYWIGFLYADGHVRELGKEVSIELGVHSQDILHLEKYKNFLGCDKTIETFPNKNYVRLRIYSKKIYDRLRELGFNNDKSNTACPHDLLKSSRDFWRGVVDGDGCLSNGVMHTLHLCGTYQTIEEYIKFMHSFLPDITKKPVIGNYVSKNFFQISFYKEALQVAEILYKDSPVYLDRKYEKYLSWIDKNNDINKPFRPSILPTEEVFKPCTETP